MIKVRVILMEPHISGNIGFIARCMKNFDLDDLYLVNPKTLIDNAAYTHAMHADNILKKLKIVETLTEATKGCDFTVGTTAIVANEYNLDRLSLYPDEFVKKAKEIEGKIGLIFGRESSGLRLDELNKLDLVINIPTSENYKPLNISHAAAIVFYELYNLDKSKDIRVADKKEKLILFDYMRKIIDNLKYFKDYRRDKAYKVFKNIINRSFISAVEAYKLAGVFRTIFKNLEK